jgi:hypothetical protein
MLKDIHTEGLRTYIGKLKPHQRATTAKIIHRWLPTYNISQKQSRHHSNLCPRCGIQSETPDHILECPDKGAVDTRKWLLYETLKTLEEINTANQILAVLEICLSKTLNINHEMKYSNSQQTPIGILKTALHHQNIVGWRQALRGYISRYWIEAQHHIVPHTQSCKKQPRLEHKLTGTLINQHKKIWEDRNQIIHGITVKEQRQKAREKVQQLVQNIYKKPPKLARWYQEVTSIPIETRLKQSTQNLQNWIELLKHQEKVTNLMATRRPPNQISLQQAVANMHKALNGKQYFLP